MLKLKDVKLTPETPKPSEAFTISGEVELFGFPFLGLAWIILNIEDVVARSGPVFAGKFKSEFPEGLAEGSYELKLDLHLGPAMLRDTRIIPPFPPLDTYEVTFTVAEVPPETTLTITMGYDKSSYKRGETVHATVTVVNTGTVTARNTVGSVTIKTPAGAPWLTIDFPKRDIAPGASSPITKTKVISSTDPTGTYTHNGSVKADNSPAATVSGSAFEVSVVPAETTIAATVGYTKV